jgi:hypothetical protein
MDVDHENHGRWLCAFERHIETNVKLHLLVLQQ